MKPDITSREDIQVLIDRFYDKVKTDDVIGFIFNEVAQVDWPKHLPVMYDFWEGVLLGNAVYRGNPMAKHIALDQQVALTPVHFDRWKTLFFETLDDLYEGTVATEARKRAESIAQLMMAKIDYRRQTRLTP